MYLIKNHDFFNPARCTLTCFCAVVDGICCIYFIYRLLLRSIRFRLIEQVLHFTVKLCYLAGDVLNQVDRFLCRS